MKISTTQDASTGKKILGSIVWIILILIFAYIVSLIVNPQKQSSVLKQQDEKLGLAEAQANRKSTIKKYAPKYCKSHQSKITTFNDSDYPSNNGSGWTDSECKKIITILYDSGSSEKDISNMVKSKVWVGMNEAELWYSLGSPDKINTSNYSGVVSKQLVYGYNYIYTDGDGIVTSYQLSS